MPTPSRNRGYQSGPRINGRQSPYTTRARLGTRTQPSAGYTVFTNSSVTTPRGLTSSQRSFPSIRQTGGIVSQAVPSPGTTTPHAPRTPLTYQTQILYPPESLSQATPVPLAEDVFTDGAEQCRAGKAICSGLNHESESDEEDKSNPMAAEHPEDVGIHGGLSRLSGEIFNDYYNVLLAQHLPPPMPGLCEHCSVCVSRWIRCNDCFQHDGSCIDCILKAHSTSPFHRMEQWNAEYFCWTPITLTNLGLALPILHDDGKICKSPGGSVQMKIMHTNGMHTVTFLRCGCTVTMAARRGLTARECLANHLFPATRLMPQHAYTFEVMNLFDAANLKAFTNINQFCEVMCTISPDEMEVSGTLRANFHTAIRQWRLFKRMQYFAVETYEDLNYHGAIESCPVCPLPGVNLPDNWENRENANLLNTTFIMGDGNFHMQLRTKSKSLSEDPSYFGDSGVFAKQKLYRQYTEAAAGHCHSEIKDPSCASQAGTPNRDRPAMKLAVSGIWALSCKHGWFYKNGVVDIPKGERFYLADVAVLHQLNEIWTKGLSRVVFTYDINCKYKINLQGRSMQNPHTPLNPEYSCRLDPQSNQVVYLVNAFHQQAHIPECADQHSIRNTAHVGMTSGEDVETPWALLNYRQYSMREMSAGARRDLIDAHMHNWNMEKKSGLGERLEDKYWHAQRQCEERTRIFQELEAMLNEYDPSLIPQYEAEYTRRSGEQFRPDSDKVKYPTRKTTLKALQDEELKARYTQKIEVSSGHPLVMLVEVGMELEIESTALQRQLVTSAGSAYQARRKFKLHSDVETHALNVFATFAFLEEGDRLHDGEVAHASSFSEKHFAHPSFAKYAQIELHVRVGHGHDLLEKVRKAIGIQTFLWCWHKMEARGLKASDKISSSRARGKKNLDHVTKMYRANWMKIRKLCASLKRDIVNDEATLSLLKGLQPLDESHLRMLSEWIDDRKDYKPNRSNQMPWIWKVGRYGNFSDLDVAESTGMITQWEEEARRLKWLHAFQSLERWKEELLLLQEELQRLGRWYSHEIQCLKAQVMQLPDLQHSCQGRAMHSLRCQKLWRQRQTAARLPYLCRFAE